MNTPKPIQTAYHGYRFRSRLEARWAVFFDACRVEWEYEPEGYDLGDGLYYLPDFLLHGVEGRAEGDLYVEVKGKMTEKDANKILRFTGVDPLSMELQVPERPLLVVTKIPPGDIGEITNFCGWNSYHGQYGVIPFSFELIDGDDFGAHPGINKNGRFELFGDDCNYLADRDDQATERAFGLARTARFEYGETPRFWR